MDEGRWPEALKKIQMLLKAEPENRQAKILKKKMRAELERLMKNIYSDSVLEENIGELEAAKEKWRQIIKMNVRESIYFGRAKNKLKDYGAL